MGNYVRSAQYYESTGAHAPHYHDSHQILFVTEGYARAEVSGVTYALSPGSLFLISRLETHAVTPLSADYRRFTVRVSPVSTEEFPGDTALFSLLVERPASFSHAIDTKDDAASFAALFRAICDEHAKKETDARFASDVTDMYLRILLMKLSRLYPTAQTADSGENTAVVRRIRDLFERDYRTRHTLASVAATYHISPYYLAHLFKDITGYPPMQYLGSCRIAAAKRLLVKTDKNIAEIVGEIGFSDACNFSRAFRRETGLSPTEFREKFK